MFSVSVLGVGISADAKSVQSQEAFYPYHTERVLSNRSKARAIARFLTSSAMSTRTFIR
jgi:hypothetical protein